MPVEIKGEGERKIVATTTFTRKKFEGTGNATDEWVWVTEAPNHEPVANGETYKNVAGALNGFLSANGHSEWTPGQIIPARFSGFQQADESGDVFIIHTYESV